MSGSLLFDDGTPILTETGSSLTTDAALLTIEDGTIVAGANSYVTVATVRNYAAVHGISVMPAADTDIVVLIVKAMMYIESKEPAFKGNRYTEINVVNDTSGNRIAQQLSWPRANVYIYGFAPGLSIPQALLDAVCQLCCDIASGFDPFPYVVALANNLQRSTIGPITKVYFSPAVVGSASLTQKFPRVEALLASLCRNNNINSINVVRA